MATVTQSLLFRHLAQTFGLTALALSMTGCAGEASYDDRACLVVDVGAECPSDEVAAERLDGTQTCEDPVRKVVSVGAFIDRTEVEASDTGFAGPSDPYSSCCYEATYRNVPGQACAVGRPLMHDGQAVTAPVHRQVAQIGWQAAQLPDLSALSESQRTALADHWLEVALLEHASVASFSAFSLDLMAHAAPPELLTGAHAAASDEIVHARMCFALASAYAGETLSPGRLEIPGGGASSLAELATATAIEGCIGETIAVMLAAEQLRKATDPAVRAALLQIIEDESRHAELAWSTLRWALLVGGVPVREALQAVFADAASHVGFLSSLVDESVAVSGHGLPSRGAMVRACRQGLERVVMPAAAALLN